MDSENLVRADQGVEKQLQKSHTILLFGTIFTFVLILLVTLIMTIKNNSDQRKILEQSIKSQILSTALSAREILDPEKIASYNTIDDITNNPEYNNTLAELRKLANDTGADYIYVLKYINNKCYFIFDTDIIDQAAFVEYTPSPVHIEAFKGNNSVGIANVSDEYGSFNTAAVPLYQDGFVSCIVSTDIGDSFYKNSTRSAMVNLIVLIVLVLLMMILLLIILGYMIKKINILQDKLYALAHYDTITGLPNRLYLLDYLSRHTGSGANEPFALVFADLDNFKAVNDTKGHDAGDAVLKSIGSFLQNFNKNAVSFRPGSGKLNISARIGGDEFIQIYSGIANEKDAEIIGKSLIEEFNKAEIDRLAKKCGVGISLGIAVYPYHTRDSHVLIKYADNAMYKAKKNGKNQCVVYDENIGEIKV